MPQYTFMQGLGPKNEFWAIWAEKFHLQFSKTKPHFIQNHNLNPINIQNVITYFHIGVWVLKTSFGKFGLKDFPNHKSQLQFSQTRPYFVQNNQVNPINLLNVIIYLKISVWNQKTSFWADWALKTFQDANSEPYFMFSQTRTHFKENDLVNAIHLSHFIIHLHLGTCVLIIHFGTLGPKRLQCHKS